MKRSCLVRLSILFSVLSFGLTSYSQDNTNSPFDRYFANKAAAHELMGNVLIKQGDSLIYKKSFGSQDIENNIPNTDSSAFAMASVTKIFTATAILQLTEKGELRLDDKYVKYYPDFPFPAITIRQLLSHTSGLPAYELFDSLAKALPEKIFMNEDVTPALKLWHKPLHNDPGEGWYYSSMNYCLLGLLVEKMSGTSLHDYFRQHIFEPAGMAHSYLENYFTAKGNPNRTVNYEPRSSGTPELVNVADMPREHVIYYNCGGFVGQGGLVTTTEDMARFDKAYFSGKLLSQKYIEEAMTPIKLKNGKPVVATTLLGKGFAGYGLGWSVGVHPVWGRVAWHTGGRPGIKTIYLHNISKDQTIFIFENVRNRANMDAMAAYTLNLINRAPGDEE